MSSRRQLPLRWVDDRLQVAKVGRSALGKVFPDHWSFMLGEIALYSFIFLVASGTFLALFFDPSSVKEVYDGSYGPLHGKEVSSAYASTVSLSWDIRGGLLIRQAHHWAAHIFIGAIVLHLCRIFFTGMFRKPRELNWMVGVTLLGLAIFNAFVGYSLPDDLLSGTGLHIFWSVAESIPVIGPWVAFLAFDGLFPGKSILLRLFTLHILIVPVLIAILITVHLTMIIRQKHTHFAGPGRREVNVVGSRMWPSYALRSLGLMFAVFAVCALMGGLAQINPIWIWGDFKTYTIMSPSVADWYVVWIEGALRLFPPSNFTIFGYLVPTQFWPGVFLPMVTFGLLYAWPLIDRWLTGDRQAHHVTGRPRDCPIRTAIGIGVLTFYILLVVAGGEELISEWTHWPVGAIRSVLRGVVIGVPIIFGVATYFIARALKLSGREGVMQLSFGDFRRRAPAAVPAALPVEEVAGPRPVEIAPAEEESWIVHGKKLEVQRQPAEAADGAERELAETPSWLLIGRRRKQVDGERPEEAEPVEVAEARELSEVPTWIKRRGDKEPKS